MAQRMAVFLNQLRESQLLAPDQVDQVERQPLARGDDPLPLAKELAQKGWLTSYQAGQVLHGRGKELSLGSYRLLDRLGEGGMGQVFRAQHQAMGRVVALKVIRKEKLASPTAVERFHQEIRAAAKLTHPNIVLAFDAGQVGDTHFFAMEYVEGTDLARLVKDSGPLGVAEACDYVRQAALGLQHAHERGLVHRDVKPGNLLLTRRAGDVSPPVIKILDMGLARLQGPAEGAKGLTKAGTLVGTPEFLAPEQAINSHVDIRADLYSLGCTFFFLLTGQPPFRGNLSELLLQHQTDEPPPLNKFRADVPPAVQAIVRKLLAKRPEERFQAPAELSDALGALRLKAGSSARMRPAKSAAGNGRASPGKRRVGVGAVPRRRVAILALVALGLLAAAGVVLAMVFSPGSASTPTPVAQVKDKSDKPSLPIIKDKDNRSPDRPDPTGFWRWSITSHTGETFDLTLRLKLDGDKLSGGISGKFSKETPIEDATYKNGEISFKVARDRFGPKTMVRHTGRIQGDSIKGRVEYDGFGRPRDWEARRVRD